MPDREKYIEVLSKAAKTVKEFNEDAPIKISLECIEDILKLLKDDETQLQYRDDHIAMYQAEIKRLESLLKEQEAKNVVNMTLSKDCFLIASCPKCNALLTRVEHKNYCGYCGQAVKWE